MEMVLNAIYQFWKWMFEHIIFINLLFSFFIVFFKRGNPKSVWAWLLLLYFIPILGIFLYLMIGQDFHKSKMFRIKEIEDEVNFAIHKQEEIIIKKELENEIPFLKEYSDLILYNLSSSGAVMTDDNEVDIFTEGTDKFSALIKDIQHAAVYVHLEYYIIRDDELFHRIKDILIEKVRAGVEVRILYDGMGCRAVRKDIWKELDAAGIRTAEFFPAFLRRLHLRLNYRNHRKIVIIDGKVGYVGGFNIGKEYIGLDKKMGHWRDTHLRITGSAVAALQLRFIQDWNYASGDNLFKDEKYILKKMEKGGGNCGIQIVTSGPDSSYPNIRNNYLRLIGKAQRSIYIQTPYFIPDEEIFSALQMAALSGIDVKIMIPCKPDHPFVYWATYSYVGDMIASGAKCYMYDNGFLHAKGMAVDGKVFCYGTANMDIRSFKLNFEVNATVYDEGTAEKMERIFMEDLGSCTEITPYLYGQRALWVRFKEQMCRLLSPVL